MPSTPDLHTRLLAEIDRQQAIADAIGRTGMLDPADRNRRLTHYRDILRRHRPTTAAAYPGGTYCAGCSTIDHDERVVALVPFSRCRELPSLAEALAIETGDADAQHP